MTLTGGFDFANAYFFRGIPQDDTGVIMWPYGDLGFALFSGEGGLKSVGVNIGTWNSLHTGDAGSDGPSGKLWYESDFYATLALGFGKGTTARRHLHGVHEPERSCSEPSRRSRSSSPLTTAARSERRRSSPTWCSRRSSMGRPMAGDEGTYLEVGVGPGFARSRASLTVPVRWGSA